MAISKPIYIWNGRKILVLVKDATQMRDSVQRGRLLFLKVTTQHTQKLL